MFNVKVNINAWNAILVLSQTMKVFAFLCVGMAIEMQNNAMMATPIQGMVVHQNAK